MSSTLWDNGARCESDSVVTPIRERMRPGLDQMLGGHLEALRTGDEPCPAERTAMGWLRRLLGLEPRRRGVPGPTPISSARPPAAGRSGHPRPPAPRPATAGRTQAPDPWCDLCDMRRAWCEHGLLDRRARDVVFATRLGNTYHARTDCNALTVPRARSLEGGHGNSRMLSMNRGAARQSGLEPCRICMGASPSGRR